ncbi:hypothetical protein [Mycobacterium sp. E2479]|uniref:hypothetical protein n=1 Tax=Mycobacterium sp. E2479 TaxID=1834134 RepID=UPI0009ECDBC0|nr:hypothetical protein [Mycobacterium sp. E2479]
MDDAGSGALARLRAPAFATCFGLLMVGLAADGWHGSAVVAWVAALIAVAVGIVIRRAATVAVLLAAVTVVLGIFPQPLLDLADQAAVLLH